MDKQEIESIARELKLKRYQMFVSLCSADTDAIKEIINGIGALDLCYWAMYSEGGAERNRGGENYEVRIQEELSKTCLMVPLLSQSSLASREVKNEWLTYKQMVAASNKRLQVYPIALDRSITYETLPEDVKGIGLFEKATIIRYFDHTSANEIFKELTRKYISALMENIKYAAKQRTDARQFVDLMVKCVAKDCVSRSVSDDIKCSDEVNTETLKEVHILTNEIDVYDTNTYSCMIISGNLSGGGQGEKNAGVKYFYYCPDRHLKENWAPFKNKIGSFIKKDEYARLEVVEMLRREYCQRHKIADFFETFQDMKKDAIYEKYGIVDDGCKQELDELLNAKDALKVYYDYEEDKEIYAVPEQFTMWLTAKYENNTNKTEARNIAYAFIDFMKSFVELLNKYDNNSVLVAECAKYCRHCIRLRNLEMWQLKEVHLARSESNKLVNSMLNAKTDDESLSSCFPQISQWLLERDGNGDTIEHTDAEVNAAMANLYSIPLKPGFGMDLCYSFVLFINEKSTSASWYTTGVNAEMSGSQDTVIAYEADRSEHMQFAKAFCYMASLDESIRSVLMRANSELLFKYAD